MHRHQYLSALLLVITVGVAGCGKDAPEPPKENIGGGLGKQYNEMLDQARQSVDQTNQQMQNTEQRIRDSR